MPPYASPGECMEAMLDLVLTLRRPMLAKDLDPKTLSEGELERLCRAFVRGIAPVIGHPWETAYLAQSEIPWDCEAGFSRLRWLP